MSVSAVGKAPAVAWVVERLRTASAGVPAWALGSSRAFHDYWRGLLAELGFLDVRSEHPVPTRGDAATGRVDLTCTARTGAGALLVGIELDRGSGRWKSAEKLRELGCDVPVIITRYEAAGWAPDVDGVPVISCS